MLSDYEEYFGTPQQLAKCIIDKLRENKEMIFPIDPFELLSMNGVIYQFRDFKELEGIYIVPNGEGDIPIVGINFNRPTTRQRFTAAHELCHHIKDRLNTACPINGAKKNKTEKFADKFAAELLMPRGFFEVEAQKYAGNGFVSFDDVLKVSEYFGVSFESCVFTLAYRCGLIEGDTSAKEIKKRIRKYKPDKKRLELRLASFEPQMREQIINSYKYFFKHDFTIIWNIFKNDYIYNENRIEGSKLERDLVSEIITDLRLHKQDSEYCKSELQNVIETAGQSALYDYVFENDDPISAFSILRLHKMLYQYAPFPEAAGSFRETNNLVTESKFETTDCREIINEVLKVDTFLKVLIVEKDSISVAEFIEKAIIIHHRLTVIHPFNDGNGRVSRVFLNWLFMLKGIPPIYLKYDDKERYYEALQQADLYQDYNPLKEVFFTEIIRTMIQLHDEGRIFGD